MTYNGISLLQAGVELNKELFALMVNSDIDMYLESFNRIQDRQLKFTEIEVEYNELLKAKSQSELEKKYNKMISTLSAEKKKVKSKKNIEFSFKDKDDLSIIDDENDQILMDTILNNEIPIDKTGIDNLREETSEASLDNSDEIESTNSSNEEQELLSTVTATMQTDEINFELDDEELIIHLNKSHLKEIVSATELEKAAWTKMSDNMYANELLSPFSNTGLLQLSNRYVYKFIANTFK